jgi:hypothetical protein
MSPVGTEMIDTGNAQPRYYLRVALVHCFDTHGVVRRAHSESGVAPRQNGHVKVKTLVQALADAFFLSNFRN